MNIKHTLESALGQNSGLRLNDIDIDADRIRAIMINEIVPEDETQDFYGKSGEQYLSTAIALFQNASLPVTTIQDVLDLGIYLTNAVKTPKFTYTVEKSKMEESLAWLEKEISLFPNVKVIMLMGDVAKKMFNQIAKKQMKKNVIPSGATYKIRKTPFYLGDKRIIPSYIITGGNILIEKSKCRMIEEDIAVMYDILKG